MQASVLEEGYKGARVCESEIKLGVVKGVVSDRSLRLLKKKRKRRRKITDEEIQYLTCRWPSGTFH